MVEVSLAERARRAGVTEEEVRRDRADFLERTERTRVQGVYIMMWNNDEKLEFFGPFDARESAVAWVHYPLREQGTHLPSEDDPRWQLMENFHPGTNYVEPPQEVPGWPCNWLQHEGLKRLAGEHRFLGTVSDDTFIALNTTRAEELLGPPWREVLGYLYGCGFITITGSFEDPLAVVKFTARGLYALATGYVYPALNGDANTPLAQPIPKFTPAPLTGTTWNAP